MPLHVPFYDTWRQHEHRHNLCKWRICRSWLADCSGSPRLALGAVVLATSPSHVALCSPFSPSSVARLGPFPCHGAIQRCQPSNLSWPESNWALVRPYLASSVPLRHTHRHEHFQVNRRSLSSSSHHHPAAKNMEIQVLCRWVAPKSLPTISELRTPCTKWPVARCFLTLRMECLWTARLNFALCVCNH